MNGLSAFRGVALIGLFACAVAADEARADTRAIVIGITEYAYQTPLPGAAPDADDIRMALAARGITDIEVMTNNAATRARLEAAVKDRIAKSAAGDVLLLTFAGHGSAILDAETGKPKKAFLLADYAEKGRPLERFSDDDLRAWSRQLEERKAFLVTVLDACHSGIGLRNLPPRGQPLTPARFVAPEGANIAEAGPPDPIVAANAYVFGATDSALRVHEAMVDGASRGALSFAFARAVEGAVDRFGGSLLTARDVRSFVSQVVRNISQNSQTPQFHIPDPTHVILRPPLPASRNRFAEKPVTLVVTGGTSQALPRLSTDRVKIEPQGLADITWDPSAGQLRNVLGDAVANNVAPPDLAVAVDAYWVYRQFVKMALAAQPLTTKLSPEATILCNGSRVALTVGETSFPHVVIFALAGNGLVQYDYVGPYGGEGRRTPHGWEIQFRIDQPFGADYMIVIATDQPVPQLEKAIKDLDERKAPLEIYRTAVEALKGRAYAMSVHERYSADDTQFPELCRPNAGGTERQP